MFCWSELFQNGQRDLAKSRQMYINLLFIQMQTYKPGTVGRSEWTGMADVFSIIGDDIYNTQRCCFIHLIILRSTFIN